MTSLLSNVGSTIYAGVIGAVAAKAGGFFSKCVTKITKRPPGTILDSIIPFRIQSAMFEIALRTNAVAKRVHDEFIHTFDDGSDVDVTQRLSKIHSTFIAPITEEIPFRLILQEGTIMSLQFIGVPSVIAKVISIASTSIIFGMAHNAYMDSERFSSTAIAGLAYGMTQELSGIAAAIIAHGVLNASVNYL